MPRHAHSCLLPFLPACRSLLSMETTYPTNLRAMIEDLHGLGFRRLDVWQAAEFLAGRALSSTSSVTLTLRNKVLVMLEENGAPR